MKKISKFLGVLILTLIISSIGFMNINTTSAYAYGELKITQVGDTISYGGNSYRKTNMKNASTYNTVHTNVAALTFRVYSNYNTGATLKVNGDSITNPRYIGFSNMGDYCYITVLVPGLYNNMNNRVEVIDGGVGCPRVSDSVYINVE
ncbi:hypothetical protein SAMN04487886_102534 [Clostridium sp. DSM 8431]|uniref:hypothetical protein n=1 Tax=Clostridium sp. DSM 8431 TaxID=1761781 RepID=UPI0008F17122|nr:hypothetical protein [Clostridium sp. DSM 8431]SFU42983.1 hypothetical protein SAMN04487886_102534 [Clostridium sp. DSM 8431]